MLVAAHTGHSAGVVVHGQRQVSREQVAFRRLELVAHTTSGDVPNANLGAIMRGCKESVVARPRQARDAESMPSQHLDRSRWMKSEQADRCRRARCEALAVG